MILVRHITEHEAEETKEAFQLLSGVSYERVPPISPEAVLRDNPSLVTPINRIRLLHQKPRQSYEDIDSVGALGCTLSHRALWKEAAASPRGMLILERRISTTPATIEIDIVNFMSALMDSNIVMFASFVRVDSWTILHTPELALFHPKYELYPMNHLRAFLGTQAYWLSPEGARILLRDSLPIDKHVDAYIHYVASQYPNDVFTCTRGNWGLKCNEYESTIGHGGSFLVKQPGIVVGRLIFIHVICFVALILVLSLQVIFL